MGKDPVVAPGFAYEGMAIFLRDYALRGFAYVGNDVGGFDRIALN
jgi:hypothetical protein